MIGTIISIVFTLIVLGVVLWGIMQLLPLVAPYLPAPFYQIIRVLLIVLIVLVVVYVIAGLLGVATPLRLGSLR